MKAPRKYVAVRTNAMPSGEARPHRWAYRRPVHSYGIVVVALRKLSFFALLLGALGLLVGFAYKLYVDAGTAPMIYSVDDAGLPHNHVALVFGAGLNSQGGPSAMLYDRVAAAADLYKSGKVDKLLMSGDNGAVEYNEVEVMRTTALNMGVSYNDIVLDYAGFNTWDSCYRAHEVFGLSEATLVTQRFHLPRALHACRYLKVKAVGVAADRQPYDTFRNELREFPALATNGLRILFDDKPRFLGPKVDVDDPQQ